MPIQTAASLPQIAAKAAVATQGTPERSRLPGRQATRLEEHTVASPSLEQQPGMAPRAEAAMAQADPVALAGRALHFEAVGIPGDAPYRPAPLPQDIPTQGRHGEG